MAILATAKTIFLHLLFQRNRCEPKELLTQKIEAVLDALQQTTKFSHDQFYGPVRALENRKLQISLGNYLIKKLKKINLRSGGSYHANACFGY